MIFPPWKKAEDLIEFPTFNLPTECVTIKVTEWKSVVHPFGEIIEAWTVIEGISPKWCTWKVFAQVASCCGIMSF